jgi:hypothetical protein
MQFTRTLALLPMLCLLSFAQAHAKPTTKLTMDDAKKIALTKETGTVKSGELEHEKGLWIYSFDIQHEGQTREVNVDANSGKVVEDSVDTPADEAKEAAEDAKKGHGTQPRSR